MPHTIETAPRNKNVLIEDRTFGTYDVAHWSPEAGGWVGENGEPIKYTPSHWYPMPGENYLQQGDGLSSGLSEASTSASRARRHRFFPFFLIGTTLVAAALIGVAALVRQAMPTPEARQSSENEPRQEVLAKEPAEAATAAQSLGQEREKMAALARDAAAGKELAASTVQHALGEERARSAALATELAKARQAVETQVALSSKRGDETAQLKQAAESETAELRQSLQQEHDRAEALATELAEARQAVEQKPAAVEERPRISLPAWANNDAFVKPAQAAKQPDVAPDNSKPAIKLETVPLPKRVEHEPRGRAMSADHGYGCQHYRTYDPASGTYKGYDGQRHSCP